MTKRLKVLIAGASTLVFIGGSCVVAESLIASRIETRIESELPKASGVSASIPLIEIPQNLSSNSIKSAEIKIDSFALKGSEAESAIAITAKNISKSKPTLVGSLDLTATIPASTIIESAEFENAQIVGNTLQIAVGAGGLGQAKLIPKFSNNTIYFALQSVSIFGNEISSSSLPADVQNQIKSRSVRELNVPKGLKLKSVSLSSKGLSINLRGSNIQLGKLGLL
jgi:hypothetical protein